MALKLRTQVLLYWFGVPYANHYVERLTKYEQLEEVYLFMEKCVPKSIFWKLLNIRTLFYHNFSYSILIRWKQLLVSKLMFNKKIIDWVVDDTMKMAWYDQNEYHKDENLAKKENGN